MRLDSNCFSSEKRICVYLYVHLVGKTQCSRAVWVHRPVSFVLRTRLVVVEASIHRSSDVRGSSLDIRRKFGSVLKEIRDLFMINIKITHQRHVSKNHRDDTSMSEFFIIYFFMNCFRNVGVVLFYSSVHCKIFTYKIIYCLLKNYCENSVFPGKHYFHGRRTISIERKKNVYTALKYTQLHSRYFSLFYVHGKTLRPSL